MRIDRLILVDHLSGLSGAVDQHRAGVEELLHLELAQRTQQQARPLDVELAVERVFLSGEIEIGGKVDHADDIAAVLLADLRQRRAYRFAGREVGLDDRERVAGGGPVQPDDGVFFLQGCGDRLAEIPSCTGDQHQRLVPRARLGVHGRPGRSKGLLVMPS